MKNFRGWLSYDPETGIFLWLKTSGKGYAGSIAGTPTRKGYLIITVRGRHVLAHRLAWWFYHSEFPSYQIDHINGDKADNRIGNLREATNAQNHANRGPQKNNTSGIKGVYWYSPQQCWKAQIVERGETFFLGYFKTKEAAAAARRRAEEIYQKEFAWNARHHGPPTISYARRPQ